MMRPKMSGAHPFHSLTFSLCYLPRKMTAIFFLSSPHLFADKIFTSYSLAVTGRQIKEKERKNFQFATSYSRSKKEACCCEQSRPPSEISFHLVSFPPFDLSHTQDPVGFCRNKIQFARSKTPRKLIPRGTYANSGRIVNVPRQKELGAFGV